MTVVVSRAPGALHAAPRQSLSLDGAWDFRLEGRGGWRKANVPGPWQAAFADLRDACGVGIYARAFTIPPAWRGREVAVRFGAVSYFAEVFLNGERLGAHEGGYLPFEFVLPDHLLREENRIEVRATLPDGDERSYPEFPFAEIPHGKQSWYGPLGGIWQPVALQARDRRHISACRIRADLGSGAVAIDADYSVAGGALLSAVITGPDGNFVATAESSASGGGRLEARVADVRPWSPDHPDLYRLTLRLQVGGEMVDEVAETFGFRSFVSRDGGFFLNGEPFYMRGALDQDYYPDGICTPPSTEFLEDQLRKAKALGLNLLRCHIKVPDPRYYEVADRLGMLVWTEIPNVETFTERSTRRLRDTMEGILARDGNHPSIVAWTLINEDWGTRLREAPEQRRWLAETFDWLKAADPERLVVDNSPCAPNYHVKTDINDFHYYRAVPERREEWDRLTEEFAAAADWTFTPHGDAERSGDEPLVVSEFGVWGLPHPAALRDEDGSDPWWFAGGDLWGDGAASPQGLEERFAALRLERVFGGFDAFIEAAQWRQFDNLKYQIETMRAHPTIAGYVVTELTDVHWEANGLMDMRRNPRVFHERFAEVNADIAIVPGLERWAFWAGEEFSIAPKIAAGGRAVPEGSVLEWGFEGKPSHGRIAAPATAALAVRPCAVIRIPLPAIEAAEMMELCLRLLGPAGEALAVNRIAIAVHPPRGERRPGPAVATDDPALAERLSALGYAVGEAAGGEAAEGEAAGAGVFVTRRLDAARIEAIRLGQNVLLLAESGERYLRADAPPREPPHIPVVDAVAGLPSQPYFSFPGYGLVNRDHTIWRGDWVTNFSWLRRDGAFAALPGGPMLDLAFDRVVPRAVMTGFRPWEFDARVQAGLVAGWIRKPAATIIDKAFGRGRLVATTFRLTEDAPGLDPTATVLLDCLIRQATG